MKVLAAAIPPLDCLAVPRLELVDYQIDVERFFEKVILCHNVENGQTLREFQRTYPDRFNIFFEQWKVQPRLHRELNRCDYQFSSNSDLKNCFADEVFKAKLENRKPQGKLNESRDSFYQRIFEPFVEAAIEIKIVDPYLLNNLAKPRSGAKWLLENKLTGLGPRLILITVEPTTRNDEEKDKAQENLRKTKEFLTRLSRDSNSDIYLYILPSSSNLTYSVHVQADEETSDKHDRLWQFTYPDGILGIGLTKGTEYFASSTLKSAWKIIPFSVPEFGESLDGWLLHSNQLAQDFYFGNSFPVNLGLAALPSVV
jgi:hypothetical protein